MFSTHYRLASSLRINSRSLTNLVRIVEVGPRDGLQNIMNIIPTNTKIDMINQLSETGLRSIEVTSFVSPKWVPQMADSTEVFTGITKNPKVEYSVLVPNLKGLEKALCAGVEEVVLFTAASETFTRKNINCSIAESIENCKQIREVCKEKKVRTRGIISCIAGCPYEGEVNPTEVAKLAEALLDMGCFEVCMGDTIGVGTPKKIRLLFQELKKMTGGDVWKFAAHCHDTYGQALVNILEFLEQGVRVFDSSVAGLGGCPYAPGASGNVSTEDLLYLLHGEGMTSGVDLEKVIKVGEFICEQIPALNHSKVGNAILSKEKRATNQC